MARILLAEDNPIDRKKICSSLQQAGIKVDVAISLRVARQKLKNNDYDLAIVDRVFDGEPGDGIELVKSSQGIPVIVISGKQDTLEERIKALEEGGVDAYLFKPLYSSELVAQTAALLRRTQKNSQKITEIKKGNIFLDIANLVFEVDKKRRHLNRKEFNLLRFLVEKDGVVASRKEIFQKIWGVGEIPTSNTVDVHIRRLRCQLEGADVEIETVRNVGYRIV